MTEPSDDRTLLMRCEADPDAFRVLYQRHSLFLLSYLRRGSGDAEVAVELLAETMALAYEHRAQHNPERGTVRAWLFGIARHQLQRFWRQHSVELGAVRRLAVVVPIVDEVSAERIDAMVDAERMGPELTNALDHLSPSERDAVLLRVLGEREYPDIATQLECSPGAARVRVHRGLTRLKTHLEGTR